MFGHMFMEIVWLIDHRLDIAPIWNFHTTLVHLLIVII